MLHILKLIVFIGIWVIGGQAVKLLPRPQELCSEKRHDCLLGCRPSVAMRLPFAFPITKVTW